MAKKDDTALSFNILVKEEDGLYVAHCLELDIVATSEDIEMVQKEMVDLIAAQVDYAFSNENLDNLYHPAPPEVWKEFFECTERIEKRRRVRSEFRETETASFVPPWIVANTCQAPRPCHVH